MSPSPSSGHSSCHGNLLFQALAGACPLSQSHPKQPQKPQEVPKSLLHSCSLCPGGPSGFTLTPCSLPCGLQAWCPPWTSQRRHVQPLWAVLGARQHHMWTPAAPTAQSTFCGHVGEGLVASSPPRTEVGGAVGSVAQSVSAFKPVEGRLPM